MLDVIDIQLENFVKQNLVDLLADVTISFEIPSRELTSRFSNPVINLCLYWIRSSQTTFDLKYKVSAFVGRAQEEHAVLGRLITLFRNNQTIVDTAGFFISTTLENQDLNPQSNFEFWSAVDNTFTLSFDLNVRLIIKSDAIES